MASDLILVVDDEENIRELCRMYLDREGYRVAAAADGEQALRMIKDHQPALVILDLMLPGLDGFEVCRRTRQFSDVPILMLTARDDDIDKIVGLEVGADDYLTKPFNPREMIARVKAILRRTGERPRQEGMPIQVGDVALDPSRREVSVAGQMVDLRAKEFDLLHAFLQNEGIVLTREKLLDQVWGYDYYGQTRTVDVHVAHIRKKLSGSDHVRIVTVTGVGYKLVG